MLTVNQALGLVLENTPQKIQHLRKKLLDAQSFTLAERVVTDRDYPPFPRATMDGYALRLEDLEKENKFNLIGEIFAGDNWTQPEKIKTNSTVKIMTGAPVPECFDVVIKKEDSNNKENIVTIQSNKFKKWMNIARQGEDAEQGKLLGQQGTFIDDSFLTIAASLGYSDLYVLAPPLVSLISTGNEILPVGAPVLSHQIRESNSVTIRAMLKKFNAKIHKSWLIPDNPQMLAEKISECMNSDICIITGGVSAGEADFIPSTLKSLGVQEIFHKVMIRPGKPIWFGRKDDALFFGLPGNPVSARITFKIFVEPCIRKLLRLPAQKNYFFPILKTRTKMHDFEEYFRVKIINQDNQSYLQEIESNGSGDFINSLESEGIAIHPADKPELPQNSQTQFLFW